MKAKSIKGNSTEEIRIAIEGSLEDGFAPTLAFVFLSVGMDKNAICEILDKNEVQIFGATSEGEIVDGEILADSASIMLLDLNPDLFKIHYEDVGEKGYFETAKSIARKSKDSFNNTALLFTGSGIMIDPYVEKLADGFKEVLGNEAGVYGGMAGFDYDTNDSFVFTNNCVGKHSIVVVAIDSDIISVKGIATCCWKPIGTTKTVTKSKENQVYEIDGEPPLDLVMRYAGIENLGDNFAEIQTQLNHTLQIQLQREKGNPIMRVGIADKKNNTFLFIGSMPEGSKLKFCLLPDLEALDESVASVENLKREVIPDADAVLLFSCSGLRAAFGPEVSREVEGINKIWGAPMAGFYCQGEFARPPAGNLEVHNLTSVCVALKEI